MNSQHRILHVLDHSLPHHSGYTFRTRAILKAQMENGWDIRGLTGVRHYQHGLDYKVPDEICDDLQFHRTIPIQHKPSPLKEWQEISALQKAIVDLHKTWPFELIHAHSPALNGLAAVQAAKRLGIPALYEIRAFWEDAAVGNGTGREGSIKYRLTRALENHVVGRADAVAVICEGLRRDLIARGFPSEKIMVSPNGVDMGLFGAPPPADVALAKELGLEGADVVGFIGSFYDYEGIDDLITAMPALIAKLPKARLLLVGGGPMEAALRVQADASQARDAIHFVGRVPHHEVERYYSLIDVLAYPRKNMRLTDLVTPLKPLEAMAQGRIVAASDVGGHRELIKDGVTGTLFSADSPIAMANALAALFDRRESWDAQRKIARRYVEEERNWQKNIQRYDPVYHLLLNPK